MKTKFNSIGFSSLFILFVYLSIPSASAQWQTSGSNTYLENGNVGIGIKNPIYKLHSVSHSNHNATAAYLWGEFHGVDVGVNNTSRAYSAFSVFNNMNANGSGLANKIFTVLADGNVGIGIKNPIYKLHSVSHSNHNASAAYLWGEFHGVDVGVNNTSRAYSAFSVFNNMNADGSGPANKIFTVLADGSVGIGTATPTHKLDVRGTIRANEIIVNTAGADFVFADGYQLRPLQEVEQFITENKHLPDIASADRMAENGVGVSELQTKLLQKVEELTLYVIEQEKQNESLKKQVDAQQREIEVLKQIIN